jgi:biotin-dependent carboxylase-like uncharacterized protein
VSARVLRGGLLAIVVDEGRTGFRAEGVPAGGAADTLSYAVANLLAGNRPGAACIEVTLGDFAVLFERATRFALSGADCGADVDGARVDAWGSYDAVAGSTLTLRRPRAGVRSYLAIAGGIDVPVVMNARDTNLAAAFGGYEGRALRTGDVLAIGNDAERTFAPGARPRCKPPQWDFARSAFETAEMPVRLIEGGEYALLDAVARDRLWSNVYAIDARSNRMGARLNAAAPIACDRIERASHAVFPGVVQLPPSGEPIVLLADAQTTGGYPKLGVVLEADLWKVAQLGIHARLRFVPSSLSEAAEARGVVAEYVVRVEASLP